MRLCYDESITYVLKKNEKIFYFSLYTTAQTIIVFPIGSTAAVYIRGRAKHLLLLSYTTKNDAANDIS